MVVDNSDNDTLIFSILSKGAVMNSSAPDKYLTSAELHLLDNQASDADDEAESICTDSDNSSTIEPASLNQNDHGLHKLISKATLRKRDHNDLVSQENERRDVPSQENNRERLIRFLAAPPPGPQFRTPVAVMYLTDENGKYAPDENASAKRQKLIEQYNGEQQPASKEEYVEVSQRAAKEVTMEDSEDSLGSPAVMIEAESSEP